MVLGSSPVAVITTIKEIDVNNEIQIAFSIVIHLDDQDFGEEI